jgi:hypothetical protein
MARHHTRSVRPSKPRAARPGDAAPRATINDRMHPAQQARHSLRCLPTSMPVRPCAQVHARLAGRLPTHARGCVRASRRTYLLCLLSFGSLRFLLVARGRRTGGWQGPLGPLAQLSSELRAWADVLLGKIPDLSNQVHAQVTPAGTQIHIDHKMPQPLGPQRARFRITNQHSRNPS